MGSRLQPALLGGVLIGVLSALPFISSLNACCCVWVVIGGLLTTYLLQERSSVPVTAGSAAGAGFLAGIIGAVLASILGAALMAVQGGGMESLDQVPRGDLPPQVAQVLDQLRDLPPTFWYVAPVFMFLLVFPVFSTLGALLGVALFRRTPPPPPPGTVEILPPE